MGESTTTAAAAALAAALARRFCFFLLTGCGGSWVDMSFDGCDDRAFVEEVGVDGWEGSAEGGPLGTVMILEPSLFVYLAVAFALGEAGACVVAGWRWLAGILVESCCDGAVSVGRYHGAREGRVPGPDRLGGKSKSGGKKEGLQTRRQLSWKGIGVERSCVWGEYGRWSVCRYRARGRRLGRRPGAGAGEGEMEPA
jgi:hypothetical protein